MKYKLSEEDTLCSGIRTLHRVIYEDGTIGGYIESQKNLKDDARVLENAVVYDNAIIYGNAVVSGYAIVYGNAMIYGSAKVSGHAVIKDHATIGGHAVVKDHAFLCGYAHIDQMAVIEKNGGVSEFAKIIGHTVIDKPQQYISLKNWFSSFNTITYTLSDKMWNTGCFYGTGKELVEKAYRDSKKKGEIFERLVDLIESTAGTKC